MIDRSWYERHPLEVAFDLLGCVLVVERDGVRLAGRITETEAYADARDLASHAGRLQSGKKSLGGPAGCLYMYRCYGIHSMLNIVAREAGSRGAVLIRALEPLEGLDVMQERRGLSDVRRLTVGPGVVCQAFDLRLGDDGLDLFGQRDIRVEPGQAPARVVAGPRIGITKSAERPWRLFDADAPFVSSHRKGVLITRDMLEPAFED